MSMSKKLQRWFYGGQSPAFFRRQASAIHDYNVHVLSGLLVLLTAILGAYFVLSVTLSSIGEYTATYRLYLILMVALSVSFYFWGRKSIWATNLYILLFTVIAYCFMCMIGTAFHPDAPAVMFIVFLLTMPMLLILPTHITYLALTPMVLLFSLLAYQVKLPEYAFMDTVHSITCLFLGFFLSHRVMESRMSLLAANDRLSKLSRVDALTKLPNRLALMEFVQQHDGMMTTVAMVDVDDFKHFNDTYGHPQGDVALRAVADTLRRAVEPGCFAARYGGEEFLFIDTVHTPEQTQRRLEKMRSELYAQNIPNDNSEAGRLTLSIGCAARRPHDTFDLQLQRADDALYQAKGCGKNCVRPYAKFVC